jgi:hypothetical protein
LAVIFLVFIILRIDIERKPFISFSDSNFFLSIRPSSLDHLSASIVREGSRKGGDIRQNFLEDNDTLILF